MLAARNVYPGIKSFGSVLVSTSGRPKVIIRRGARAKGTQCLQPVDEET